jgi:outer membrane receptor for monomeric catechols
VDLSRAYLNWLIDRNWSVTLEYLYEGSAMREGQFLRTVYPTQLDTNTVPLNIRYFDPAGFFAGAGTTYVDQRVDYDPKANSTAIPGDSDFVLFDVAVGYRLPKRWGILALEVRNLTDEHFQYQDYSFLTASNNLNPQFLPERTVLGRFILNF